MKVSIAQNQDHKAWLILAKEVEHLFGPMADEESFQMALSEAIDAELAFCVRWGERLYAEGL